MKKQELLRKLDEMLADTDMELETCITGFGDLEGAMEIKVNEIRIKL